MNVDFIPSFIQEWTLKSIVFMVCELEYMNMCPLPPPIIEFATPLVRVRSKLL